MMFDFKIASILLLYFVGHFHPTTGYDQAIWSEFSCKESQFEGIERNNLRQLLILDRKLYFLFESYAIRLDLPEIYFKIVKNPRGTTLNPGGTIRLDFLLYRTPEYVNYTSLTSRPGVLELNDATGLFHVRISDGHDQLFVIRETGFGQEYNIKLTELESSGKNLFKLGKDTTEGLDVVKKEKYQLGFIRTDNYVIMNANYNRDTLNFVWILLKSRKFVDEATWPDLTHRPERAIYFEKERNYQPLSDSFRANILEVERHPTRGTVVHIHEFELRLQSPPPLTIVGHEEFGLSLLEFLDCPMEIETVEQMKGSFSTRKDGKFRFYLFADDFYYKTGFNLFRINYNLIDTIRWRTTAKKVQFADDLPYNKRPKEEKLTMKYVKELYGEFYVTWNNEQTHLLRWENAGKPDEILRAEEQTDRKLHECDMQIFTVRNQTFCFGRQQYYFFSGDGGKTVVKEDQIKKYPIDSIFWKSDLEREYTYEDLQVIIPYSPKDTNNKTQNKFIWMTYTWLFAFDMELFTAFTPNKDNPYDRQITLGWFWKKNIPNWMYAKHRNCLFKEDCSSKRDVEDDEKRKPRSTTGSSWLGLIALVAFFFVLIFTVWILFDVKFKTNLAFLDNLRTNIRKKIHRDSAAQQSSSAEKGDQKLGEPKSVKSTSSLGATTKKNKSVQSLGGAKAGGAAKSGGSPKAKLAGKKSAEKANAAKK